MDRGLQKSRALWRFPGKVMRKARQGPGAFTEALAHHLWRRGPLHRMRRALALRTIHPAGADGGAAECPCVPGLVSVVLPVYNQADLLGGSIESVLSQSYANLELIVVDDGSTDDVGEVLGRYLGNPKVRILTQANQKLPAALSNGFAFARGEFWTWTSADNLMHPDQLARLVGFLRSRQQTAMVYADYVAIDERGEPFVDPTFRPDNRRTADSAEIHLPRNPREINVVCDNFIGPCFLYRNLVGRLIGDYDPGLGIEDYDYWMRVNHAFLVEHLGTDEILYRYRVHDRSLSGRAAELKIAERVKALMRTERSRNRFYRRPWTIRVDSTTKEQLADCPPGPHRWIDLDAGLSPAMAGRREQEKVLYLVDSTRLDDLAVAGRPDSAVVAAWFDDVEEVYERRIAAARVGAVGFAGRRDVAERLDLLGIENLVVDSPGSFVDLVVRYANNRCFYERSLPEPARWREPPDPLLSLASRHVLIQVDDFLQGGLENVVLGLASGLRRRGFRVSMLVLGRRGPAVERAREDGISVATLAEGRRDPAYLAWLREQRVDLVYAHYSTFGARVAAEFGIPFVQVVHNTYVWLDERAVDAYREADAATTGTICVSAEVARYCDRRMGLSVDKMIVVPNGVDLGRLDASRDEDPGRLREELGLSPHDFVFLNVASIHATKAQVPMLRALARVLENRPDVRLVIVGSASDPEYERRLRRRIGELELEDHVILAGQRRDVGRFYWMADAFVLPSFWEGWSLALTEAACAGLPLVATDVGGARELLADGAGRLVETPFASITDLDAGAIDRLVHGEEAGFVADLANAMGQVAGSRRRFPLPDGKRRLHGEGRMIDVHSTILAWFLQGGRASAARVWCRATPTAGCDAGSIGRERDAA